VLPGGAKASSVTTDVSSSYRSNELDLEIFQMNFYGKALFIEPTWRPYIVPECRANLHYPDRGTPKARGIGDGQRGGIVRALIHATKAP
jgi:hypothetical protein